MKVNLELPAWVDGRNIDVFTGIEQVAKFIRSENKWYIKTQRCNNCGECCKHLPSLRATQPLLPDGGERCVYLEENGKEYMCGLHGLRPHACSIGDDAGRHYCNIKWEKLDAE